MVFYRDGHLTAWENACPHEGRSLNQAPGKFLFSDSGHLVCAHHGATFELPGGECVDGPCPGAHLTAIELEKANSWVLIRKSG